MAAELPVVFVVAGEDAGHHAAVTALTDRVLAERVEWLRDQLEHCRTWRSATPEQPWYSLRRADRDALAQGLRTHGHFGGAPGLPDARSARAQLLLWKQLRDRGARIDGAFLARDLDQQDHRLGGILQAVQDAPWPFEVIVAWFQPEAEAWLLGGFEPRTAAEHEALAEQRRALGFCPVRESHRLLSTRDDSPKDSKRVLEKLTGGAPGRRVACLQTDLQLLHDRGAETGMHDFLTQVETRVVPLFAPR